MKTVLLQFGSLWDRLINVHYLDLHSEPERVRLRMLNIISLISWGFTWTYAFLHVLMQQYYPSFVTFSLGVVYLFIIFLNHYRHTLYSKVIHTINSNIGIYAFSQFLGLESGVHLYVLLAPLFVLSLFSITEIGWITFCIGIYVMNYFIMMYFPESPFFPRMEHSEMVIKSFYHMNIIFSLIMTTSITAFVLVLNNRYIHEMLNKNEILTLNETKLKEEITKRIESEESLRKLFEELSQSYKNLEQFSYVVSHNIRAPLTNILGYASLYDRTQVDSDSNNQVVDAIEKSANILDEILTDLNRILKARDRVIEQREPIVLTDIIETCKRGLKFEIEQHEVELMEDYSVDFTIHTSKSVLRSILQNLISNSIKYRHPERVARIVIAAHVENNTQVISVSDNGIGIDLIKYHDRIFKLYNRFHREVQGKGIGLYLVKTHTESLGGQIEVQSTPNVGTQFIIHLPRS